MVVSADHPVFLCGCFCCCLCLVGKKRPVAPESATVLMYSMSSSIVASCLLYLFVLEE